MYEDLGLISKPLRRANGYRVFSDVHIDQFRLARTAFQIEVLQSGLRKRIIEVVKRSAEGQYDEAIELTNAYIGLVDSEIANANETAEIAGSILESTVRGLISVLGMSPISNRKELFRRVGVQFQEVHYQENIKVV